MATWPLTGMMAAFVAMLTIGGCEYERVTKYVPQYVVDAADTAADADTDSDADSDADGDADTDSGVDTDTGEPCVAVPWYIDYDGDGLGVESTFTVTQCVAPAGYVASATDCDDTDITITLGDIYYADVDGDGYGNVASATGPTCTMPAGYVDATKATDCDDAKAEWHPGAEESCSVDEDRNCDGSTLYADVDADGSPACLDCDDADNVVYPHADEYCDSLDNDCDGSVDENDAVDAATWYADVDGDTYGNNAVTVKQCDAPSGYIANATDCDDAKSAVNPGAAELCDGVDNDCDGSVDSADSSIAGESTWYEDADGDTYGNVDVTAVQCDAPSGYVDNGEDCDDLDHHTNPEAAEYANGYDDDCDGSVDEDTSTTSGTTDCYVDADNDGFGDSSGTATPADSDGTCPSGHVFDDTDCEDNNATVNPDASDYVGDYRDTDCDGVAS